MRTPTQQQEHKAGTRLIAWCGWHNGLSSTARLMETGPTGRWFACAKCRESYRLTPLADQS